MHIGTERLARFFNICIHGRHCTVAMFVAVARVYHTAALVDPIVHRWGLASWALDLTVNGLGTLAIAGRLWWLGRRSARSKSGGRNSYLGVAIIVLESGAMFTFATFVLVILYVNTPTAQVSAAFTSIVAQIAVSGSGHCGMPIGY